LGADPATDPLLFEESNREFELATAISKDRAYVFLYTESVDTNEVRYVSADRPTEEPKLLAPRRPGVRNFMEHHSGEFLIRTDEDAPNFKLVAVPADDPESGPRREVVPHREDAVLNGVEVFDGASRPLRARRGVQPGVGARFGEGETARVPFDEAVYVVAPGPNWEFATTKLRLVYSSPVTPNTDFEIDLATGERTTLKQREISAVTTRTATSPSASLRPPPMGPRSRSPSSTSGRPRWGCRRDRGRYASTPTAATAPSPIPWFSTLRLALLDRGITFAQAHVRGGGRAGPALVGGGVGSSTSGTRSMISSPAPSA
jgi:oligopeptidase B